MSIRDVEKNASRQIESLRRRQAREVVQLEDGHKNLKSDIKKTHELEIIDIENENLKAVDKESFKKEKVLTQMKSHLDETKKLTDRELKELKDFSAKVKQEERLKLGAEREVVKSENELYLDELNHRFEKEQKRVNTAGQEQIQDMAQTRDLELNQKDAFYQNKLGEKTNKFNEKFQSEDVKQRQLQDNLVKNYKVERAGANLRQQHDMAKLTKTHEGFLQARDVSFRQGLKDQDVMFEKKYADSMKKNNEELSRLESLNTKVLTKMKTDLTQTLKTGVERSDDPFYEFVKLDPKLRQFDDRIEISVGVPEHAKADIQLTINGKEAILNFNRRYDDSKKDDGVLSKLHKVESYTSRLQTERHLDPKTIKSTYTDGVMTYVIKHA